MKLLVTLLIIFRSLILSQTQKNNHLIPGRSTIVHLFEWKWKDIAKECEDFLGPKGYAAVQISPPNENQIIRMETVKRPWWERYQPVSYQLITRSGDEAELADMIGRCSAVGVRVYADLLMNSMAAKAGVGTAGNICYPSIPFYPAIPYTSDDFNPSCNVHDYNNVNNVRNCQLVGLPDLNQSRYSVRQKLISFINRLTELGIAGYRVDAAKHMWPSDLKFIYEHVENLSTRFDFSEGSRPYFYQEVPDLGGEAISKFEYTDIGDVLEFTFGVQLGSVFQGDRPLRYLRDWGSSWYTWLMTMMELYLWIITITKDYTTEGLSASKNQSFTKQPTLLCWHTRCTKRELCLVFNFILSMKAHRWTTMNKLSPQLRVLISRIQRGRYLHERLGMRAQMAPNIEHGQVQERLLGQRHHELVGQRRQSNSFRTRGDKGFVAITTSGSITEFLQTSLPPGVYCDVISGDLVNGECSGKEVLVDENGKVGIFLDANGKDFVLAIHVGVCANPPSFLNDELKLMAKAKLGIKETSSIIKKEFGVKENSEMYLDSMTKAIVRNTTAEQNVNIFGEFSKKFIPFQEIIYVCSSQNV